MLNPSVVKDHGPEQKERVYVGTLGRGCSQCFLLCASFNTNSEIAPAGTLESSFGGESCGSRLEELVGLLETVEAVA